MHTGKQREAITGEQYQESYDQPCTRYKMDLTSTYLPTMPQTMAEELPRINHSRRALFHQWRRGLRRESRIGFQSSIGSSTHYAMRILLSDYEQGTHYLGQLRRHQIAQDQHNTLTHLPCPILQCDHQLIKR